MSQILDIVNGPWMITPGHYQEICAIYDRHLKGEKIDLAGVEARIGMPLQRKPQGYDVVDGVAIVPIDGVLMQKMNLITAISGGSSTQMIGRDFAAALNDSAVHAIMLYIDSPGGAVHGIQELGHQIVNARGQKPIVAFTDASMMSGAYWLGSSADAVYISSDSTLVGSIGVVMKHVDTSRAQEAMGIKTTEIYAGKYKTMTSSNAPLSAEAREDIQDKIDALYKVFVHNVAKNRDVEAKDALEHMADGRVFLGKEAIRAGLVDGVATKDKLLARMKSGKPLARRKIAAGVAAEAEAFDIDAGSASAGNPIISKKELNMAIDRDFLLANHPDLVEAFRAEGFTRGQAEGRSAGAAAELDRIKAVEAQALVGHEALINTLKFDGKTTGPEAAVAVLSAEKAVAAGRASALAKDANNLQVQNEAGDLNNRAAAEDDADPADSEKPLDERCKAAWDKSAKLRAEFGDNFRAYVAFEKHVGDGTARIFGAKRAALLKDKAA